MPLPDGAAQVYADRTRFSTLDQYGRVVAGANTFTTDALVKCSFSPTLETGDDLFTKNASGDGVVRYKHGDMSKYFKVQLELAEIGPVLENMLNGGVLLSNTATALTAPATAATATTGTGGSLGAGSYVYEYTACTQFGETTPAPASTPLVIASGTTNSVALVGTAVSGAVYYRWYGRLSGALQLIGESTGPTFTDTGAATPFGAVPTSNTTAGPGSTGIQAPSLGIVGNPYGVSVEMWGKAVINGVQTQYLPYFWWVLPLVKNLVTADRNFTNAVLENVFTGEAFENPNWGSGPFGDWPYDSSRVWQKTRVDDTTLPAVGLAPVAATQTT